MESMLEMALQGGKKDILAKWSEAIFESYQPEGAKFFREKSDPFLNPVGATIKRETEIIFDQLLGAMDSDEVLKSLDNIIRIRSIQEFSASEAISFLLLLKTIIIEFLKTGSFDKYKSSELIEIFSKIDKMLLLAFDIYMKDREKVCQIRINEIKRRFSQHDRRFESKENKRD